MHSASTFEMRDDGDEWHRKCSFETENWMRMLQKHNKTKTRSRQRHNNANLYSKARGRKKKDWKQRDRAREISGTKKSVYFLSKIHFYFDPVRIIKSFLRIGDLFCHFLVGFIMGFTPTHSFRLYSHALSLFQSFFLSSKWKLCEERINLKVVYTFDLFCALCMPSTTFLLFSLSFFLPRFSSSPFLVLSRPSFFCPRFFKSFFLSQCCRVPLFSRQSAPFSVCILFYDYYSVDMSIIARIEK